MHQLDLLRKVLHVFSKKFKKKITGDRNLSHVELSMTYQIYLYLLEDLVILQGCALKSNNLTLPKITLCQVYLQMNYMKLVVISSQRKRRKNQLKSLVRSHMSFLKLRSIKRRKVTILAWLVSSLALIGSSPQVTSMRMKIYNNQLLMLKCLSKELLSSFISTALLKTS